MSTAAVNRVVLDAAEVDAAPGEPLGPGASGVINTVLSEHSGTHAGILRIPPRETLPWHRHHATGHHVWVLDGGAYAFGRTLAGGSYWFVPPGHEHTVEGLPPAGCTLFYVDVLER